MKKFLSIFTLGLTLIGTAGCGNKKVVRHEIVVDNECETAGNRVVRATDKATHRTEELANKAKNKVSELAHRANEKVHDYAGK